MRRGASFWHVALLAAAPLPALAHDFWIEPSRYRPEVGEIVRLRLRVGEGFIGLPVPRDPALLERFVARTADGEEEAVRGVNGADPAGALRIAGEGTVLVGYRSRRSPLELTAEKFESYLAEEGLERIAALRRERGEAASPGREVFSRCAKSLLAGGRAGGVGFDRRLGFPLELVPEVDPAALAGAAELPLLLLYEGEPLAGALVRGRASADPLSARTARTDAAGRVSLPLQLPGPWLVTAVHVVEAPAEVDADWESFWASLTFELPAAAD